MQTCNQYTIPYKFYDSDGVIVFDDNTFPTITGSGIYYSGREHFCMETDWYYWYRSRYLSDDSEEGQCRRKKD